MRCKRFAYGLADATATLISLASAKSRTVYPSCTGLLRLSWKKGPDDEIIREQITNSFALKKIKSSLYILHTMTSHSSALSCLNTQTHIHMHTLYYPQHSVLQQSKNTGHFSTKPYYIWYRTRDMLKHDQNMDSATC